MSYAIVTRCLVVRAQAGLDDIVPWADDLVKEAEEESLGLSNTLAL